MFRARLEQGFPGIQNTSATLQSSCLDLNTIVDNVMVFLQTNEEENTFSSFDRLWPHTEIVYICFTYDTLKV